MSTAKETGLPFAAGTYLNNTDALSPFRYSLTFFSSPIYDNRPPYRYNYTLEEFLVRFVVALRVTVHRLLAVAFDEQFTLSFL